MKENQRIENIAYVCHQVNKAYCESLGDDSHLDWEEAPDWQKESAIKGVKFHLRQPSTPEESHESWMKEKTENGWVYGEEKDPKKKTHPSLRPYEELPVTERSKDYLFRSVVESFRQLEKKKWQDAKTIADETGEEPL